MPLNLDKFLDIFTKKYFYKTNLTKLPLTREPVVSPFELNQHSYLLILSVTGKNNRMNI